MEQFFNSNYFWLSLVALFFIWKMWRKRKMKPLINSYLEKNAIVVDVRSPEEFQGGHCPESINMPLNTLQARYLELDKKRPIIVCCASGGRSSMAMNFLKENGFTEVINAGAWTNVSKA